MPAPVNTILSPALIRALRVRLALCVALAAAACASAPASPPSAPSAPVAAPRAETGALTGLTAAQVERRLGRPALVRTDGAGALWTYRFDHCALVVAFGADDGRLRVTAAHAGPRRAGDPAVSLSACLGGAP